MKSEIKVLLLSPPNENLLEEVGLLVSQLATKIPLIAPSHCSECKDLVLRSSLLQFFPFSGNSWVCAPCYCTYLQLPLSRVATLIVAQLFFLCGELTARECNNQWIPPLDRFVTSFLLQWSVHQNLFLSICYGWSQKGPCFHLETFAWIETLQNEVQKTQDMLILTQQWGTVQPALTTCLSSLAGSFL